MHCQCHGIGYSVPLSSLEPSEQKIDQLSAIKRERKSVRQQYIMLARLVY